MTDKELDMLITQHAAECVQEILNDIKSNQGIPWLRIIERKMRRLVAQTQAKRKGK